jgi:hypothetical protein
MTKTEDLLAQYPAKTKFQKQKLQENVQSFAQDLGYSVMIEKGSFGCQNLLIGNPKQAKFYIASGNALSGLAAWLETIRTFPENQRNKVCFLLLDGKTGASFFRKNYPEETESRLLINLNHVGDGNHLRMYPTKRLKENRLRLTSLYRACGYCGTRDLLVSEEKPSKYQKPYPCFPYAITVCAVQAHKKRLRYIHKTKDTALDTTNVNILRAALTTFLCCDEVN